MSERLLTNTNLTIYDIAGHCFGSADTCVAICNGMIDALNGTLQGIIASTTTAPA